MIILTKKISERQIHYKNGCHGCSPLIPKKCLISKNETDLLYDKLCKYWYMPVTLLINPTINITYYHGNGSI